MFRRFNPIRIVAKTFGDFGKDDCAMMAASLSYYAVFSLPPLLFLTVVAAGAIFGRETVEAHILGQAGDLVGPAAAAQVQTMLQLAADRVSDGGLSVLVSIGALVFAATGVLVQLQVALDRVWEVRPDPEASSLRTFLTKRLVSLAALLAVAFLLIVSLVLSAVISAFGESLVQLLPDWTSETLLHSLQLVVSLATFTVVFAAILRYLPDARVDWADVWVGGFVTALLITVGKFVLGLYLGARDAGASFGPAGSLAVIMLWVYYSSMILLLGAEFTQVWAKARGHAVVPEPGAIRVRYRAVEPAGAEGS